MRIFRISLFGILLFGAIIAENNKGFTLKNKNDSEAIVSFFNEDVEYIKIGEYTHIIGSDTKTIDNGLPELPTFSFSYGINPYKDYEVSFVVKESHVLTNITLYPYQEYVDIKDNNEQKEDIIVKINKKYVCILEDQIKKYPEQYFWFHKKWDKKIYAL